MNINNIIQESFQSEEPDNTSFKMKKVRSLLLNLLSKLTPIDFRYEANLTNKEKLNSKHYHVLTIKHVLITAENNGWSLCSNHGRLYFYNGQYWEIIDKDDLNWFLGKAAKYIGVDEYDAEHYEFKERLYKQFLSQANIPRPEKDSKTVLINLQNGTYEFSQEGCKLRAFDKGDFLTYQLPFAYSPEAKAPLFFEFLNKVQPQIENQNILAEFFAYIFISTGTLKLEKALLLYGEGANGKSVIFEIMNSLLGGTNISCFSLSSLVDANGYTRANLANKLLNYASEINGDMESDTFKLLASGEPVSARYIYGPPFTLRNYAKLAFNCNILPRAVEHTKAYFRRFLIIPFEVIIPEEEQDRELSKKIVAQGELSGVFNWVLEGLDRLLKQKHFTYSKSVEDALKTYQAETDSVQQFLEDGFWEKSEYPISAKHLSSEYHEYCQEHRYRASNHINFLKRLKSLGINVERKNTGRVVYIQQISPRPDEEARKQLVSKNSKVQVEKTEAGDILTFNAVDGQELKQEGII
jgi:putative DNA primase/helicase